MTIDFMMIKMLILMLIITIITISPINWQWRQHLQKQSTAAIAAAISTYWARSALLIVTLTRCKNS